MPDGIDPAVHEVERTPSEPGLDSATPDPGSQQLPAAHHPVLNPGQLSKHTVDVALPARIDTRLTFPIPETFNVSFIHWTAIASRLALAHRPMLGLRSAQVARQVQILCDRRHKKGLQPAGTAPGFDPLK